MIFIDGLHPKLSRRQQRRCSSLSAALLLLLIMLAGPLGCGKKDTAEQEQADQAEKGKPMAVMYFQNQAPDPDTDWIGRGIAHLLITDIEQSPHLDVLRESRLSAILRILSMENISGMDQSSAMKVAQRTGAETVLFGSYLADGQKLTIEAYLMEVSTGVILKRETLEGPEPGSIFDLVDRLSELVLTELDAQLDTDRDIAAMTTTSVEAYKSYVMGLEALARFQSAQGMVLLNRSVEIDTSFALAYANMAIHTYGTGDNPRATSAVSHAMLHIDRLPEPEKLLIRAMEAHLTQHFDEGFQYYQQLKERTSPDPDIYLVLAQLYFTIRDFTSSERVYQTILQQDPRHVTAHIMLGLTQLELGLKDLAESEVQQAIKLEPNNPLAFIVLSRIYAFQGRPEDAELQLRKASQLDPQDPWIHNLLGYFYLNQNKPELALEEFKRYAALAPNDPNAHDSLAEGYLRTGNKEMAEKEYLHALRLKPDFANPHYVLGLLYNDRGETKRAAEMFKRYLQLSPRGPLAEAAEKQLEEMGSW